MINRMICLDIEAINDLENIKKKDANFNFSSFIRSKLKEVARVEENPISYLTSEIEQTLSQIEQLKIKATLLSNQKQKIIDKEQAEINRIEQEKQLAINRRSDYIRTIKGNFLSFFEISEEDAEKLAIEMFNIPLKERKSIFDLAKEKGIKEKAQ